MNTFAAVILFYNGCFPAADWVDGLCPDGRPPSRIELRLLSGLGRCSGSECAGLVSQVLEVVKDGKTLLSLPGDALSPDDIGRLLAAAERSGMMPAK